MKLKLYKLTGSLRSNRRLNRTYFNMKYAWQDLGQLNQLLLLFGSAAILSIAVTTYNIATHHYDLREIKCLALNIYHEARGESVSGQYAVATVTMNRVDSKRYPNDVCRVVYQRAWNSRLERYISAFSWTDKYVVSDVIPQESQAWKDAYNIAEKVYMEDRRFEKTKDALFYHATYVKPAWSVNKTKIATIGQHIFYR